MQMRAVSEGRSYRHFVEEDWRRIVDLQPSTTAMYLKLIRKHALPSIGDLAPSKITSRHITRVLDRMKDDGASAFLLYQTKAALSATFRLLIEQDLIEVNPTSRVRIPRRVAAIRNSLQPSDVKLIMDNLTEVQGLFVRVLVDSGIRLGEAAELRVSDLTLDSGVIIVKRSVADVGADFHPDGRSRFLVKTPKSGKQRVTSVSTSTAEALRAHIATHRLRADDLLLPKEIIAPAEPRPQPAIEVPVPTGSRTEPNERGFTYEHGALVAYSNGKCRCDQCRAAMRAYSRSRRAAQADRIAKRRRLNPSVNMEGHLPKDVWGRIWRKAVEASGIEWQVRTHDLRHANATWLLKNGTDLHTVKERLGHHSVTVTEGYLHRIAGEDANATSIIDDLLR